MKFSESAWDTIDEEVRETLRIMDRDGRPPMHYISVTVRTQSGDGATVEYARTFGKRRRIKPDYEAGANR